MELKQLFTGLVADKDLHTRLLNTLSLMEHIGSRNHTENDIPTLVIGKTKAAFTDGFHDLTGYVPRMARLLDV